MKKLVTATVLVLAVTVSYGQSKAIKAFQAKYEDDRDAKVVHFNGGLFKLLGAIASYAEDDEDAQAIARLSKGIRSMDIVAVPYDRVGLSVADFDDLRSDLKKEDYEELMEIKDGRERVYVMTQGDENEVRNMVVLVREDKDFVVMNLNGIVRMADIGYLMKHHKEWRK